MSQAPLLELDLLKTIIAIAETGNFSAAAEVVHRTPSAVSMQVKRIEDMLGRPVFVREPRTVKLNDDGMMLLAHARRVLALNADTVAKFVSADVQGTVRLGAIDHAAEQFLPRALSAFSKSHPNIRVDVLVENSKQQREALARGELEVALVTGHPPDQPGWEVECLFTEPLVWAGLKGGIAAEQSPLPLSVWEEGCIWRKNALDGLEALNRDYRITFMSAHLAGQKAGIRADLAIAPLPLSACDDVVVPIRDTQLLPVLKPYQMNMIIRSKAGKCTLAVAEAIRANVLTRESGKSIAA